MNHTGRELELMLSGLKPLAIFYDEDEPLDRLTLVSRHSLIPETEFDPYVERGEFFKGTKTYELAFDPRIGRNIRMKYVCYALKKEEWRIPAFFLLLDIEIKMPKYDEGLQRLTGKLLGYSNEEIDSYIEKNSVLTAAI